jgi:adenylyl cyclase-associated protein
VSSAPAAAAPPSMNSVFSQLNVGSNVTAGLKKVDRSQMTHKNPELRASSIVAADAGKTKTSTAPKETVVTKSPPKMVLEGNKWAIEHFDNKQDIVLNDTEIKQVVNIFNCNNCTIQITGKVNAVSLGKDYSLISSSQMF